MRGELTAQVLVTSCKGPPHRGQPGPERSEHHSGCDTSSVQIFAVQYHRHRLGPVAVRLTVRAPATTWRDLEDCVLTV